ncbi:hypothetical protein R3P38DRAFT_3488901, partial [Favolaschia claudopus]
MFSTFLTFLPLLSTVTADHIYSATYLPSNVPAQTEEGQTGTNQCGTGLNQTSMCQTAYMNSLEDWCVWAPPESGPHSSIGETERIEVAWCTKARNGTGARLIPDGTIIGAHWLITPDYIQVTGTAKTSNLNIPDNDSGGGGGKHHHHGSNEGHWFIFVGGIVFSTAFGGQVQEIFEWTNFMGPGEFCFRICDPKGKNPAAYCQHIYDEMGCEWNMPANYGPGFDTCHADSGEPMGVYGASTFHQGDAATPGAHPAPKPTQCTTVNSIGNGFAISGTNIATSTVCSSSATPSGSGSGSGTKSPSGSGSSANPSNSGSHSVSGSAPPPTNSPNGAGAITRMQSWDHAFTGFGLAAMFSLIGAAVVL